MRIACFQHEPFEGPAAVAEWASARGHDLDRYHLYRGEQLPPLDDVDMLVLMGGAMSVNDTDTLNWLTDELDYVAQTVQSGKPVFGVCLGAQLIAKAMGAAVYPGLEKEIGWFEVTRAPGGGDVLPPRITPLHWHGETFDLPTGAVRLASSPVCPNQAMRIGRAIGVQFHLESTPASVAALCQNAAADITGGTYQQTVEQILADTMHFKANHQILFNLLDTLSR